MVAPRARARALLAASVALVGCAPAQDPPGRSAEAARTVVTLRRPDEAAPAPAAAGALPGKEALEPGHGAKIASIAMHTWIYVAPSDRSTMILRPLMPPSALIFLK